MEVTEPDEERPIGHLIERVAVNLRRYRWSTGMTVLELSKAAAISRATLTNLEAGKGNPTIETLWALANTLGVTFGELIEDEPVSLGTSVIRAEEQIPVSSPVGSVRLVCRVSDCRTVEVFHVTLPGRAGLPSRPHRRESEEWVLLHEGELHVAVSDDQYTLQSGDAMSFKGDEDHGYSAGQAGASFFVMMGYPE